MTGRSLSPDTEAAKTLDAAGHVFFERIGVGGMGEVYRCGDDALQRDLAIKVLRAELRGTADAEERFLREARLTGSLQHPGIVPVHHLGRLADGRPYYTMKLVRGRTLAELLRHEPDGPERLSRLLAVVEKVCQAMAFAHSKGIIHRDLKPSNVMVGEFGEVQVMDWGLAKQLSRAELAVREGEVTEGVETVGQVEEAEALSRAGAALGTLAYMPPEQAAGDWDIVDERADVFALGAILCEVLTGRPPYHGANRDDLLRRARRGDMAEMLGRLEHCGADAALVDLCRECLAAERLHRPRQAGIVAERLASYQAEVRERLRQAELERARAEVQVLEERKRAEVQAREELTRRRLRRALGFAALLLLSGGLAVWWQWQQRQADNVAHIMAYLEAGLRSEMRSASHRCDLARADRLSTEGYDEAVALAEWVCERARKSGASWPFRWETERFLADVRVERQLLSILQGEKSSANFERALTPAELAKYRQLKAILEGTISPADAHEALTLAKMLRQFRKWNMATAAAARLYADAFAAEPRLTDPIDKNRYNAACSAALAAAGQEEDGRLLPDKVADMFRRWSLRWLRDDLTAYADLVQDTPAMKESIRRGLVSWKKDSDLVSVRDAKALDRLQENERVAWQELWRDVDELLKRVSKEEPAKGRK
jgi:hypothetical protein